MGNRTCRASYFSRHRMWKDVPIPTLQTDPITFSGLDTPNSGMSFMFLTAIGLVVPVEWNIGGDNVLYRRRSLVSWPPGRVRCSGGPTRCSLFCTCGSLSREAGRSADGWVAYSQTSLAFFHLHSGYVHWEPDNPLNVRKIMGSIELFHVFFSPLHLCPLACR